MQSRSFLLTLIGTPFRGCRGYGLWMAFLLALMGLGAFCYAHQFTHGLVATGLDDRAVWGLYIGNFTFLVGVAAAAVMLVVPAYLFGHRGMARVTPYGEALGFSAVVMSLMFVFVDLGQPLRIWHAVPFLGTFNFPASIMAWDMVVLMLYGGLCLGLWYRMVHARWRGVRASSLRGHWLLVVLAVVLGIGIHTVTAFMMSGVVSRPFWNSAVMAPRFIASAFAAGAGVMILAFKVLHWQTRFRLPGSVVRLLSVAMASAMLVHLFLLGSELFVAFYGGGGHGAVVRHLYGGSAGLSLWMQGALALNAVAFAMLIIPPLRRRPVWLNLASLLAVVGVWMEKGVGLVVPGLVPTPLGEMGVYMPTGIEMGVAVGIWGLGAGVFTLMVRGGVALAR
ncbi:MAG: polysulfide reductase NrfD [Magnetococcales bacterium]|nr:polysulfide reductase NrfD [Magnetococcales bacterium]